MNERKFTISYVFSLGSGVISWASKKKPSVALSTIEVEYKATCEAICLWLCRILCDLKLHQMQPITLDCDNQSEIKMIKNPI
jgi:hypothetical protein